MKKEIQLISQVRHLKRKRKTITFQVFLLSGVLICGALSAEKEKKKNISLACVSSALIAFAGGQFCIKKLNKKEEQIKKKLFEIQKEHT